MLIHERGCLNRGELVEATGIAVVIRRIAANAGRNLSRLQRKLSRLVNKNEEARKERPAMINAKTFRLRCNWAPPSHLLSPMEPGGLIKLLTAINHGTNR